MKRYYFDIRNSDGVARDIVGLRIRGPGAACEEALQRARRFIEPSTPEAMDVLGWFYEIRREDEASAPMKVPFFCAFTHRCRPSEAGLIDAGVEGETDPTREGRICR